MIEGVRPGVPFEAVLEGATPELVGTITVRVIDPPNGPTLVARTTEGITEDAPGVYAVELTVDVAGTFLVVWDYGDPDDSDETFTEQVQVGALATTIGDVTGAMVLTAVETLMAYRLRAKGFAAGAGGTRLGTFTTETTPTLARATEMSNRQAAAVLRDFPSAEDVDAADLVDVAALRSAIELEASADNMDPERVKVWRDSLKEKLAALGGRLGAPGSNPDGGERGLDPKWYFGPVGPARAAGSECANVPSRRLRW